MTNYDCYQAACRCGAPTRGFHYCRIPQYRMPPLEDPPTVGNRNRPTREPGSQCREAAGVLAESAPWDVSLHTAACPKEAKGGSSSRSPQAERCWHLEVREGQGEGLWQPALPGLRESLLLSLS